MDYGTEIITFRVNVKILRNDYFHVTISNIRFLDNINFFCNYFWFCMIYHLSFIIHHFILFYFTSLRFFYFILFFIFRFIFRFFFFCKDSYDLESSSLAYSAGNFPFFPFFPLWLINLYCFIYFLHGNYFFWVKRLLLLRPRLWLRISSDLCPRYF